MRAGFARSGEHNASLLSAGIAYYAFLAMVPLLASVVLGYGLFAGPDTVARHIDFLADALPASAAELIGDQLAEMTSEPSTGLSLGLLASLVLSLIGARNAAGSIIIALNVAYGIAEGRSFVRRTLAALGITALGAAGVGIVAALLAFTATIGGGAGAIAGYAAMLLAAVGGAAVLYRIAPHRAHPDWRDVLPGAVLFALGWLAATGAFGMYVANFGNYNATYGSLGAVVVLVTWLYLSAYLLLLGGEFNAVAQARSESA